MKVVVFFNQEKQFKQQLTFFLIQTTELGQTTYIKIIPEPRGYSSSPEQRGGYFDNFRSSRSSANGSWVSGKEKKEGS